VKKNHVVKMKGIKANGLVARTQQVDQIVKFENDTGSIAVSHTGDRNVTIKTNSGEYELTPHATMANLWIGVCNNVKVHYTQKKIVGKVVYWA